MIRKYFSVSMTVLAGLMAMALSGGARAQLAINDDFTQATDTNPWQPFGGACLTAGVAGGGGSNIPGCVGLPYYRTSSSGRQ